MDKLTLTWILLGLLFWFAPPVRAEFTFEQITLAIDATKGEAVETDLYCFSDWEFKYLDLDLTNKFSWPESPDNYRRFNIRASFEKYRQLDLDLDYQWNERYRILAPAIAYDYEFKPGFKIKLKYETDTRNPVLVEDAKLKYHQGTGSVKMALDMNNWSYDLKLARSQKDYPEDEVKNSTKNQLDQELAWRIRPDLKVNLSYCETSRFYPNDLKLTKEYWGSTTGIGGEYQFNNRWQMTGSLKVKEAERGLIPYLDQQNLELKLKNEPTRDLAINLTAGLAEINYHSKQIFHDPDEKLEMEEDLQSRVENKAALECYWKVRNLKLEIEAGLFWVAKDYNGVMVEDLAEEGIYLSFRWKPNQVGVQLELAPDGNVNRVNGFYLLKLEYYF